jgi:hypothetical protein
VELRDLKSTTCALDLSRNPFDEYSLDDALDERAGSVSESD